VTSSKEADPVAKAEDAKTPPNKPQTPIYGPKKSIPPKPKSGK
jgi:hypothetical protein